MLFYCSLCVCNLFIRAGNIEAVGLLPWNSLYTFTFIDFWLRGLSGERCLAYKSPNGVLSHKPRFSVAASGEPRSNERVLVIKSLLPSASSSWYAVNVTLRMMEVCCHALLIRARTSVPSRKPGQIAIALSIRASLIPSSSLSSKYMFIM